MACNSYTPIASASAVNDKSDRLRVEGIMVASTYGFRRGLDLGAALLLLGLAACASMPPPTEQMAVSRVAVDEAVSAGSAEYASALLASAQDKLARADSAMAAR